MKMSNRASEQLKTRRVRRQAHRTIPWILVYLMLFVGAAVTYDRLRKVRQLEQKQSKILMSYELSAEELEDLKTRVDGVNEHLSNIEKTLNDMVEATRQKN